MLHIKTPLRQWKKKPNIYFKLDNLQPSGSFKIRGVGNMVCKAVSKDPKVKLLVSSSGGNAGLAVAVAGASVNLPVHVFVPETTPASTIARLEEESALVMVVGKVWDESHEAALAYCKKVESEKGISVLYVPPFDHPDLWEGHSTVISELSLIEDDEFKPDVVVCSVGGGGLFCGILEGLQRKYGNDKSVKVIAVETFGAESFARAIEAGEPVTIPAITSVAKSLGARKVAQRAVDLFHQYENVESVIVSDKDAMDGVIAFANDQRMLVEPACGASLSLVYNEDLYQKHFGHNGSGKKIVIIVCGGSSISLDMFH